MDCRDKALALLSRRTHFRRQLADKLAARGYDDLEIEQTLDELTEHRYLDDRRAAQELVEARLRRGPVGRRRMRFELERRGAPEVAVEEALEAAYAERSDLEGAREAAARWQRRGGDDPTRLARHLDRLGFATASILRVVEELRAGRDSD